MTKAKVSTKRASKITPKTPKKLAKRTTTTRRAS